MHLGDRGEGYIPRRHLRPRSRALRRSSRQTMKKHPRAVALPTDPESMKSAIDAFNQAGLVVTRTSTWQLKCGDLNFWPNTGRMSRDPGQALEERGIEAFIRLVRARDGVGFSLAI